MRCDSSPSLSLLGYREFPQSPSTTYQAHIRSRMAFGGCQSALIGPSPRNGDDDANTTVSDRPPSSISPSKSSNGRPLKVFQFVENWNEGQPQNAELMTVVRSVARKYSQVTRGRLKGKVTGRGTRPREIASSTCPTLRPKSEGSGPYSPENDEDPER